MFKFPGNRIKREEPVSVRRYPNLILFINENTFKGIFAKIHGWIIKQGELATPGIKTAYSPG